jgi:hypothetical protein
MQVFRRKVCWFKSYNYCSGYVKLLVKPHFILMPYFFYPSSDWPAQINIHMFSASAYLVQKCIVSGSLRQRIHVIMMQKNVTTKSCAEDRRIYHHRSDPPLGLSPLLAANLILFYHTIPSCS